MLVTCPECGARYEVEAALIPPEGRSVQCSACDHVWNEMPVRAAAEEVPLAPPPLADEVRAILREEAEREARLRRERGQAEIRPELALPARPVRPPAGPLPDPDAINATLRAASMRAEGAGDAARGGGFATGLVLGLCLVGLAALAYAGAERIAQTVPAAAPVVEDYVDLVDGARAALDRVVRRATAAAAELAGR